MPIIASAKKRMRQNDKTRVRNHAQLSKMRSLYKNLVKWSDAGEGEKVSQFFDEAQKSIDTCAKKNLIHKNNAAHKKSRIARLLNKFTGDAQQKSAPVKAEAPTKKSAA